MDEYVESDLYGYDNNTFLCLGIVITSNSNGNYEYSLRYNTSGGNTELPDTINTPITTPLVKYILYLLYFKMNNL